MIKKIYFGSLLFFAAALLSAANLYFKGTTDKSPIEYKSGETMKFSVSLMEDGKPVGGKRLFWTLRSDEGITASGESVSSADKPFEYETSLSKPGFVHLRIVAVDENGKQLKDSHTYEGGACADFAKIKSSAKEPKDFDSFWKRQKARLAKVPLKSKMVKVKPYNENYESFEVWIDCVGKPVRAFLSYPKGAAEKSLPASVIFSGYGVYSVGPELGDGKSLVLRVNPHSIDNGRPKEYYEALKNGELKGFGWNEKENSDPETTYFNHMILRAFRSLEFVKSQPQWDGKNLAVSGGSMGAFQCISAAALDHDVTYCHAVVPWMCDLNGVNVGRLNGWLPKYTEALGYYDTTNQVKRVKCELFIDAGLGDYTCPPSGEAVLYNNAKCKKTILFTQGRTHSYQPPEKLTCRKSNK